MTRNRSEFGKKVRRARQDQDVSLRELSRRVGIDYSHLSRIERGKRPPPELEVVIAIAKELDIGRSNLLKVAGVPEEIIDNSLNFEKRNWIPGKVVGKEGSLIKIDAGDWTLHIVEEPDSEEVFIGLRPEDVTLYLSDEGFSSSSARNRIRGTVACIENYQNYNIVTVDCGTFDLDVAITDTSLEKMNLSPENEVFATFKATAPIIKS
mgnify:CR=1 FL=1